MTDRDKHIARKRKEIEKIAKQQVRLITKVVAMGVKPSKCHKVNLRRIGKMMVITFQVRALEMQKQMIIAQPIPKVNGFLPGGLAIVGERGPELIVTINGKVEIK